MAGLLTSNVEGMNQGLSASYFKAVIAQIMATKRQPLKRLQRRRDDVQLQRSLYADTQTKLNELKDLALSLSANQTDNIFGGRAVTVTDNDPDNEVLAATASNGAGLGTYDVGITTLAAAHRVASAEQSSTSSALGLSGTFYIGGESSNSVSGTAAGAVSSFSTASVQGDNSQLGTDRYFVEFRKNGSDYQFRLVDSDGQAISISDSSDGTGSLSSEWQTVTEGTTWDTGRGLAITFTSSTFDEATMAASMPTDITNPGSNVAYADYIPQGAAITVATSDSLESIRDEINAATFPSGSNVEATIVGNRLMLAAERSGTFREIKFTDTDGILNSLGFLSAGAWDTGKAGYQAAANADFSVNGISFKRSSNTVSTVVSDVTFTLKQAGSTATAAVEADNSAVIDKLTEFLDKFNELQDYIKDHTKASYDSETGAYSRGGLASDTVFTTLRGDLVEKMTATVAGQPSGYQTLRDIGITQGDNFHFSISDSAALESALESDYEAAQTLVSEIVESIYAEDGSTKSGLLAPLVDSTDGTLALRIEATDDRLDTLEDRIADMEHRLEIREQQITQRFGRLMGQVAALRAERAYASSILSQSLFG